MPATLSLTRRSFLGTSAIGMFLAALPRQMRAEDAGQLAGFMTLSSFVTGHQALAPRTGQGLWNGLCTAHPNFAQQAGALANRIASDRLADVEALADALQGDALHDTLLAIVAAWYSGVTATGSDAIVHTFDRALMYQPARDAVPIPTYALNGPNWWTVAPPALSDMPAL
ncbi:sugar dehydrogenase complex small subunit [Falsirhodobacter sp. alg1]|uniref:sugar dehydrogenase complex small subunit n=1 Tax=Falsirhodobacter sp. alg1 TaxID=1472418 RepID=UPI00069350FE|nr:sugar dehydrogenase complex small subunit [Falsirhodobacter sp. alg1]